MNQPEGRMSQPGMSHWKKAKRLLRYLKGTSSLKLTYKGSNLDIKGFFDSDLARNLKKDKVTTADDARSKYGYTFI